MDHGETALHKALRQKPCSLDGLLGDTDDVATTVRVNAKNREGLTPLMLACMTRNADAARLLLAHGARRTVSARGGSTRRTAADYAEEHGLRELAASLRDMACKQVETCSTSTVGSFCDPGERINRCSLCGDRLAAVSKFHLLANAARRGEHPSNKLVRDFLSDDAVTDVVIDALSVQPLHAINRARRFTRELTESLAVISAVRRIIGEQQRPTRQDRIPGSGGSNEDSGIGSSSSTVSDGGIGSVGSVGGSDGNGGDGDDGNRGNSDGGGGGGGGSAADAEKSGHACRPPAWHVIDLCCGRSCTSAILSRLYPHFQITAVDRLPASQLPHYEASGIHNVRYVQGDVLSATFADTLAAVIHHEPRLDGSAAATPPAASSTTAASAATVAHPAAKGAPLPVILVGMHLCGELSLRAVDLFTRLSSLHALVLAPCCLPSSRLRCTTPHP